MIDVAVDVIRKRYDKRHNPVVGDTVCVICAGNGNIYSASNEYIVNNDVSENIHAERNAIKKMTEDGQTRIKAITVFNSCTTTPLLPCNGCIQYILSLCPENINTIFITPNGNIPITEIGRFAVGPDCSQTRVSGGYYSVYTDIPDSNRGASLYSNPSGGFMPAMNSSVNIPQMQMYQASSGCMMPKPMNSPMVFIPDKPEKTEKTGETEKTAEESASVRTSQNGVNNILKNKLNSLFNE